MDNIDPNQIAADALKYGMAATTNVSELMGLVSNQTEALKRLSANNEALMCSLRVMNVVHTRVQKATAIARQGEWEPELLEAIEHALKIPELRAASPKDLEEQIEKWIKDTEPKGEESA